MHVLFLNIRKMLVTSTISVIKSRSREDKTILKQVIHS